jgi:ribosomal protein L4
VTIASDDAGLVKSVNNIPKVAVLPVNQLNAGDICNHRKMLFTKEALLSVLAKDQTTEN